MEKIAFLFLTGIFLVAGACFAQEAGQEKGKNLQKMQEMKQRVEEMLKDRVDKLTKELSLTIEQAAKLKDILNDYGQQIKQIMKEAQGKARQLHLKEKEAIKTLLTPEQEAKFETLREKPMPAQVAEPMSVPVDEI